MLFRFWIGGAEEDRTPDLRIANASLSQLSYGPTRSKPRRFRPVRRQPRRGADICRKRPSLSSILCKKY